MKENVIFSHKINKCSKQNIESFSNEYHMIPFGHSCISALAIKYASLRKMSLPFDWTKPLFPRYIQKVLENDFTNYIPDVKNGIFTNCYNFRLAHFNPNIEQGIEQYKRRINRFRSIMKDDNMKYFVYMNEDFLYNAKYRDPILQSSIFHEMLELDRCIRKIYMNMKYKIIYFSPHEHIIPNESNIFQIVVSSSSVYNKPDDAPYDQYREYCGKVLANIFKTRFKGGYQEKVFYET